MSQQPIDIVIIAPTAINPNNCSLPEATIEIQDSFSVVNQLLQAPI